MFNSLRAKEDLFRHTGPERQKQQNGVLKKLCVVFTYVVSTLLVGGTDGTGGRVPGGHDGPSGLVWLPS